MLKDYPKKDFILQGFSQGFNLGFIGEEKDIRCKNNATVRQNPLIAKEKIFSEIKLGRIAGPFATPPFTNFRCSPLALREKTTPGKYRLLHNLSAPYNDFDAVNTNIPEAMCKVSYDTIDSALKILAERPFSFLAKSDISEAFRLIPLSPESYRHTGFCLNGEFFYDRCLPMGASSSCKIFEAFSDSLKFILQEHYSLPHVLKVLDDFLFISDTEVECKEALEAFRSLCSLVGVPISEPKTVEPTRNLVFLGYTIDLEAATISIPLEKIAGYKEHAQEIMRMKKTKLREVRSMTGQLGFVTNIIPGGRCFLRRLYDLTKGKSNNNSQVVISRKAKRDLKTWISFMDSYNGKAILSPRESLLNENLNFHSDSSNLGYAACFGKGYIQGKFPSKWRIPKRDIQFLELYPIYIMVELFAPQLANKKVVFITDNKALVGSINKQSSRNFHVMNLLRPMVLVLMKHNIIFSAEHIEGKSNVFCDKLSRFQIPEELQSDPQGWKRLKIPLHLRPASLRA